MGPLTTAMRRDFHSRQRDVRFDIEWTSLGEYLEFLERRGIACNVASLVGATTLRIHEIGHEDRAPTASELARMCDLARAAMREGALGLGSALIYAPASYARPEELQALASAVAEYGGLYVTHLRSESRGLLEAIEEVIAIARLTRQHAEIWPFQSGWRARVGAARRGDRAN